MFRRFYSFIGKKPICLPQNVSITQSNHRIHIQGPHGRLQLPLPPHLALEVSPVTARVRLAKPLDLLDRKEHAMWGTTRALLSNHIRGVSERWQCIVRLVGIGYRVSLDNTNPADPCIVLKIGFANLIRVPIVDDVEVTNPTPTSLILRGIDKQRVTQFAAKIRAWRKPEPYKGKGIFVDDETIALRK
ncbi:mitochondrial 54S ribosomal protein YmL16 [Schizosaccharomyces japonicus yFS275]|uniref:Ribosomal protein subunit L16 n=1 Tax=Schizosaccharomyces japonicus (strain yFS275 / FY16936) TaxID=402676 RepID=B6JY20_SCHJY|nr:mitochondrial 54S ribosomal protein YmL16 [Schizosaccharomyces japonicus yFS275]EEB06438.1 ribosomal protein subunit L16 [Schizosaccharomyces japonicus yFS275]